VKSEAFFHLTNNVAYVFLLVLAMLQLPNMLIRRQMEHPTLLLLDVPLFLATCGSVAVFYLVAHRDLRGGWTEAIKWLPAMMALGIGLAVNNGRAVLAGLLGGDVEFIRTPKRGDVENGDAPLARYRGRWSWHNMIELAFALYCVLTLVTAITTQSWASIPFVLLFSAGFLYVGATSLYEGLQLGPRQNVAELGEQAPSTHSSPRPQSMLS
jgi:hypothetical protein